MMGNPEEINRVCTDHVGTLLLAATQSGMEELSKENLIARSQLVGDPMFDAFLAYSQKKNIRNLKLELLSGGEAMIPERFYYLTCHRAENTKDDVALLEILRAMAQLDAPTVYPVHPRNKKRAMRLQQQCGLSSVILVEPVGYLESTCLVLHAEKVVTDSGGVQREAFFAKKKCVTIFDFVAWPETMVDHRNDLAKPEAVDILEKLALTQEINPTYQPFGDGHAAEKIVAAMEIKSSLQK